MWDMLFRNVYLLNDLQLLVLYLKTLARWDWLVLPGTDENSTEKSFSKYIINGYFNYIL